MIRGRDFRVNGAPGRIRTSDRLVRSQLRAHSRAIMISVMQMVKDNCTTDNVRHSVVGKNFVLIEVP